VQVQDLAHKAVLQTARIAYVKALKAALPQAAPPFAGDTIKLG